MQNERNDEIDIELERPKYVGKFVCYDQMDGGACWGKIKDLVYINTLEGEKLSFILTNRIVRYLRTRDVGNFRKFYPDYPEGDLSSSSSMSMEGKQDGMFFENRFIGRDSLLMLDSINVETDIIDCDNFLDLLSEGELFSAVMEGRGDYDTSDKYRTMKGGDKVMSDKESGGNILEIGIKCLLGTEFEKVKDKLMKRMKK
jgi:hypothetical protein